MTYLNAVMAQRLTLDGNHNLWLLSYLFQVDCWYVDVLHACMVEGRAMLRSAMAKDEKTGLARVMKCTRPIPFAEFLQGDGVEHCKLYKSKRFGKTSVISPVYCFRIGATPSHMTNVWRPTRRCLPHFSTA